MWRDRNSMIEFAKTSYQQRLRDSLKERLDFGLEFQTELQQSHTKV